MNRIKKVSRPVTCLLALLLCVMLLASTAFAAGGALGADRNGTPYTYVIGYMYSGSSQTVNTREIFTSPNNYDIWLCPVCGRDPLGNSQGTALAPNLYMPCYGYDIAAAGGDMSIRYALVRHRHNNGQLSNDKVYIPVNVPMYAGCYIKSSNSLQPSRSSYSLGIPPTRSSISSSPAVTVTAENNKAIFPSLPVFHSNLFLFTFAASCNSPPSFL